MRVYFTKHFPFGNFRAINLFGRLYFKDKTGRHAKNMLEHPAMYSRLIQHERTHTRQMKETGYIPFYIWYGVEWLVKLFTEGKAYKNVSFEREARAMEKEPDEYHSRLVFKNRKAGRHYYEGKLNIIDNAQFIEFVPSNSKGSLIGRKPWNWTKYVFHR